MKINRKNCGFSLIELAIVIMAVAVILGIISTARSLVDDSKLKSIMADFVYYQSAFVNFKNVYKSYPGDMANATDYWTTTCATTITCNGDGNGVIDYRYGNATTSELERAWKHLSLSGLIKNSFGITTTGRAGLELGVSAPKSQIKNAGYMLVGSTNIGGSTGNFIITPFPSTINAIYLGGVSYPISQSLDVGSLTASNAFLLDYKFDDGVINSGNASGNATGKLRTVGGISSYNTCINVSTYYHLAELTREFCVVGYQLHE